MLLAAGPHRHQSQDFRRRLNAAFWSKALLSPPTYPPPGRAGVSALAMTRRFSDHPESTTPDTTLGGSMKASSRPQGPCKCANERSCTTNLRDWELKTRLGRAQSNQNSAAKIKLSTLGRCRSECGVLLSDRVKSAERFGIYIGV